MAPEPDAPPDGDHVLRMGRLRKLERLGLATEIAPGQWTLVGEAQTALRELGERDDIIKRMHKAMSDRGIDRSEEHTSELQSLMRNSYAVFCLYTKNQIK